MKIIVRFFRAGLPLPAAALAGAFGLTVSIGNVQGAPVPINNHSFESANYTGTQSWTYDLTDADDSTDIEWDGRDGNFQNDMAFIERIGGFAADGLAHIGMNTGYWVYQDTGVPWQANRRYVLTVAVGRRNGTFSTNSNASVFGLTNNRPDSIPTQDVLDSDPLLAQAHAVVNVFNEVAANSQFGEFSMAFETGATAPAGTIVVFLGDNSGSGRSHYDNIRLEVFELDADGDGLPSDWEIANGLNPNSAVGPDGADGDPDNDLLTNLQEFQRGTKANVADTDGDGALDGWETRTGVYVSPTDIGTDPLNPDSDFDTIPDGAEIAGPVITDPNLRDTDGDGFEDHVEIAAGTNPSVGGQNSFPVSTDDVIAGVNFIGGRVDGTPGASVEGTAGVVPQGNWVNAPELGGIGLSLVDSSGAATMMRVDWTVDDTFTVDQESPADANSALMLGYLKTRKEVETRVVIRNIPYPEYDVYVYADGAGTGTTANYTVNGQTITGVMDEDDWPIFSGGGSFQAVIGNNSAGNYMIFRNVTGSVMTLTAVNTTEGNDFGAPINAVQIVRSSTDADNDGMPDAWEVSNGLNPNVNDAAEDPDNDGLTNLQEYQLGTLPKVADTDGDGLPDGVETNTGVWVSESNRGTNPLLADSDGDGLGDAVENNSGTFVNAGNPGTDPNKADTDGDTYPDGMEVRLGSNPLQASSVPAMPAPIGYWPFDDRGELMTKDLSARGNDGAVEGEPVYVPGRSGAAGDYAIRFDGEDDAVVTAPLLDELNEFTLSGWVNFTEPQANRTGLFGANDCVEFGMIDPDTLELWTPTGGAIQVDFGPSSNGWRHLAVVADDSSRRIYIDGVEVASGGPGVPTEAAGYMFNIGGAGVQDASGNYFNGIIDDVAVWDVALDPTFIERLAAGGSPLGTAPPPSERIEVRSVTFNAQARSVTLTFSSTAGKTYTVERSDDLSTWTAAGPNLTATGESTEFTDSAIPDTAGRRYYRVRGQP